MTLGRMLALPLALAAATTTAHAGDPMPGFPWIGHGEGARLSDEAPKSAELGCPTDDTAAKRALLAAFAQHARATTDPEAREVFPGYAPQLQAWFERWVVGVPGVGTWAEAQAVFDRATQVVTEATASQGAPYVIAHLAAYRAAIELEPRIIALDEGMAGGPCDRRFATRGALRWQLHQAREAAQDAARAVVTSLEDGAIATPPAAAPPPATYWEHVAWVKARIEYLGSLATVRATVDPVRPLAAVSPALAQRIAELDARLAGGDALAAEVVAELARVAMPDEPVDKARVKTTRRSFATWDGGAPVGRISGPRGVAKDRWVEKVEVGRDSRYAYFRQYPTRREAYTVHVAVRPAAGKASAPPPPGVDAAALCELYAQEFQRFTQGPPSFQRAWHETYFGLVGFVPCANVDRVTTLPMR